METKPSIAVLGIDPQNCFASPQGSLFVPGSVEDMDRFAAFIANLLPDNVDLYFSEDNHAEIQIFFPSWWQYADTGQQPAPFTVVVLNENNEPIDAASGRLLTALYDPEWSLYYLQVLRSQGKKDLILWPPHAIEGTPGQNLVPSIANVIKKYERLTGRKATIVKKGNVPQTEHFGMFAAEVPYPTDQRSFLNTALLEKLATYDLI